MPSTTLNVIAEKSVSMKEASSAVAASIVLRSDGCRHQQLKNLLWKLTDRQMRRSLLIIWWSDLTRSRNTVVTPPTYRAHTLELHVYVERQLHEASPLVLNEVTQLQLHSCWCNQYGTS